MLLIMMVDHFMIYLTINLSKTFLVVFLLFTEPLKTSQVFAKDHMFLDYLRHKAFLRRINSKERILGNNFHTLIAQSLRCQSILCTTN
jgi:hypothetical protein